MSCKSYQEKAAANWSQRKVKVEKRAMKLPMRRTEVDSDVQD
jgi:hypothetical protein